MLNLNADLLYNNCLTIVFSQLKLHLQFGMQSCTFTHCSCFPDQGVHQQNLCGIKNTCELVYSVKSPTEKVSKFQHSMLSRPEAYDPETGIWWLLFQENKGMFYLLCKKHVTHNAKNKTKYFRSQH